MSDINNIKIGIIGCGHLGQAIAESLINHEFRKENILISYKNNPSTYKKISQLGLTSCISENKKIFNEADVIFIAIKPQDIMSLKEMTFSKNLLIVSCAAGLTIEILKSIFKTNIFRIMLSGPDTIASEKGVAALYPYNKLICSILNKMNLRTFEISREIDMNIFTTGVCLPAALLYEKDKVGIKEAVDEIGLDCSIFLDLYDWAKKVVPSFNTETKKTQYISKMITKGGITEAIIDSLKSGEKFITALRKGMARGNDISQEIKQYLLNSK
ncbi:MAG: NAD(P)-binding domain-containing protein [Bacillota bacterium]|nr:NAD(P)-binding domain-containing protein [Bacillota bacterium]